MSIRNLKLNSLGTTTISDADEFINGKDIELPNDLILMMAENIKSEVNNEDIMQP